MRKQQAKSSEQALFGENDPDRKTLSRELLKILLPQLASTLMARGELEIEGKSDTELEEAIIEALQALVQDGKFLLTATVDYRQDLLRQARTCVRKRDINFATVYYATYFEHQMNGIISDLCSRKDPQIDPLRILREANLNAKCTWILEILGAPVLGTLWVKRIMDIAEARNAFLHYKWRPLPDEPAARRRNEIERLKHAEKTVRRLQRYEDSLLHSGMWSRLRKIAVSATR